ncbi:unnamed protein product [Meganyctiphanes norvegica]|uniref:Uncharacterized protein n=1 Tax=Meganyctiphanes norvegica TaxID=48144 RepID=A0AAV2Q568_MEGNR
MYIKRTDRQTDLKNNFIETPKKFIRSSLAYGPPFLQILFKSIIKFEKYCQMNFSVLELLGSNGDFEMSITQKPLKFKKRKFSILFLTLSAMKFGEMKKIGERHF